MNALFTQLAGRPRWTAARSLFIASLTMGAFPTATAQNIYSTGFEKPAFTAGLPLVGQDGWIAPPPLSPNAALIVAGKKQSKSGQTVRVEGANLEPQESINDDTDGYYDAIGSYRRAVNHDTGGTQTVRISADVLLDGKKPPHDNFFSAGIAAIGVEKAGEDLFSSGIGELAISSDGNVYGYSGQNLVPVFLASVHVALGKWHELAIEVDFAERTYSFYVDDDWLGTFDFDPSANTDILRRGSMITYAAPDTTKNKKADRGELRQLQHQGRGGRRLATSPADPSVDDSCPEPAPWKRAFTRFQGANRAVRL